MNNTENENRHFIEFLLTEIKLDTFSNNQIANVDFDLVDRGENDRVRHPRTLYFKCDAAKVQDKSINTVWKIEFQIFDYGIVFADKTLIEKFGIVSGYFTQSFEIAARLGKRASPGKK